MSDPIPFLRARNPVPAAGLDDPRFAAPMGRLEDIMAAPPAKVAGHPWRRPTWAVAFAMLVAAVVASVVLFTRGGTSQASAAFERLADATEVQRVMVTSGRPVSTTVTVQSTRTVGGKDGYVVTWSERTGFVVQPDGTTVRTTTTSAPRFPGPQDRQRWIRSGSPEVVAPGTSVETVQESPLSAPPADELSTPDRARRYLIDQAQLRKLPGAVGPFVVAQDLLGVGPLNPQAQENIYRALASIDGVVVFNGSADGGAVRSVVFSVVSDHTGVRMRHEMQFDATNGQLAESSQTVLDPQPGSDATNPVTVSRYTATPLTED